MSSYCFYRIISTLYNQLGQFIVLSHDSNLDLTELCIASTSAIASLSVGYLLILLQSFIYDTNVFTISCHSKHLNYTNIFIQQCIVFYTPQ